MALLETRIEFAAFGLSIIYGIMVHYFDLRFDRRIWVNGTGRIISQTHLKAEYK